MYHFEVHTTLTFFSCEKYLTIRTIYIFAGGQLLFKAGVASGLQEAYNILNGTLHNGAAISKFAAMMKAQGVQAEIADSLCEKDVDVFDILPKTPYSTEIKTNMSGKVHSRHFMTFSGSYFQFRIPF